MFKIGDKAWYRGAWGRAPRKLVTITGIGGKNDETVYDTDDGHWGYVDQFEPLPHPELHPIFADVLQMSTKTQGK